MPNKFFDIHIGGRKEHVHLTSCRCYCHDTLGFISQSEHAKALQLKDFAVNCVSGRSRPVSFCIYSCIALDVKDFSAQWNFLFAAVPRVTTGKHNAGLVSSFHCRKVAVLISGLCSNKIATCALCRPAFILWQLGESPVDPETLDGRMHGLMDG